MRMVSDSRATSSRRRGRHRSHGLQSFPKPFETAGQPRSPTATMRSTIGGLSSDGRSRHGTSLVEANRKMIRGIALPFRSRNKPRSAERRRADALLPLRNATCNEPESASRAKFRIGGRSHPLRTLRVHGGESTSTPAAPDVEPDEFVVRHRGRTPASQKENWA